jgi:hypothetical protein
MPVAQEARWQEVPLRKIGTHWILLACLLAASQGLGISSEPESVKVELQGSLAGVWAVRQATVEDNYIGTYSVVEIENVSKEPTVDAAFYGEYFDAAGRFCLAVLFAQDENDEGRAGPFLPGEVRHLRTSTFYLNPASRPARLKLSGLADPILNERGRIRGGTGVLAPPALEDVTLTGKPWERVWLGPELESARGPLLDLVLARVGVDSRGDPKDVEIMGLVSPSARSWFEQYMQQQRFRPARIGSEARDADALILVRAIVSLHCIRQKPWPPRESPAVREYVGRQAGKRLLPIITVILRAVTPDFWEHSAPDYFEILGISSDWSVAAHPEPAQQVHSVPGGPSLQAIVAPPEAYSCP